MKMFYKHYVDKVAIECEEEASHSLFRKDNKSINESEMSTFSGLNSVRYVVKIAYFDW